MHPSLAELLESLRPGLLWVTSDGTVRYANGDASARTGLTSGRKLYDPDLSRAVGQSVAGREPRTLTAAGSGAAGNLACRVIPGLAKDDAFVLIDQPGGRDGRVEFDNFLHAVRVDLRDPLCKARAALTRARGTQAATGGEPEVADEVGHVLDVLDKLVDLAGLWSCGTLMADDRIELWPLLQLAWADVEPQARARSVQVRFHAQTEAQNLATLYGSEHWLRRVFVECLDAAVRASAPGALLKIEHWQMGPRALIVFRDCGVFLTRRDDLSSVSMPAAGKPSGAPVPMAAREQISFKLCQHIVSLHGGHLREEREEEQRNFLIELPTGAPHRDPDPQLDVAQAQRYASDLAALMTRARRPTPPAG